MSCSEVRQLIELLADGEASPEQEATAAAHLDRCVECRGHEAFLAALSDERFSSGAEPPPAYWDVLPKKVMTRIEAERSPSRRPSLLQVLLAHPVLRFGGAAASLALLIGLGVLLSRDEEVAEQIAGSAPAATSEADTPSAERRIEPAADAPAVAGTAGPEPDARAVTGRRELSQDRVGELRENEGPARSESSPPPAGEPLPATPAGTDVESRVMDPGAAPMREETAEAELAASSVQEPEPVRARQQVAEPSAPTAAAFAVAVPDLGVASCDAWRRVRDDAEQSDERRLDARYYVALCSLERYDENPGDATLERARADIAEFLSVMEDGERADELRRRERSLPPP